MRIDLKTIVRNPITGDPLPSRERLASDTEAPPPTTLGLIAANALYNDPKAGDGDTATKIRRFDLARDCLRRSHIHLDAKDIVLIQDSVERTYPVGIFGQVANMLAGKPTGFEDIADEDVGQPDTPAA